MTRPGIQAISCRACKFMHRFTSVGIDQCTRPITYNFPFWTIRCIIYISVLRVRKWYNILVITKLIRLFINNLSGVKNIIHKNKNCICVCMNDAWTCKSDRNTLEYLDVSPHTPYNTFGSNTFRHAGDQMREDQNLFEKSLLL